MPWDEDAANDLFAEGLSHYKYKPRDTQLRDRDLVIDNLGPDNDLPCQYDAAGDEEREFQLS
eukprot:TRINITY_DN13551_c0_g1_i1.p1 TRINITY_DN13551_c0_g1~~TRINITY_DN13551_c0_g1_i1.p1  ORF type:complete len:62 (-),score=7.24 TRINITY_DN13551_c0_g1_i1:161-346(-)